jgi:DNA-3-methyladenine glycosylase
VSTVGSAAALGEEFFARSVHRVARELVGCTLLVDGVGGVIVETEAYEATDPACHAYVGRTARNDVLFGPPARAYVYLSYGIHSLLNAVCEPDGEAAAVLIRALEPTDGLEAMRRRRGDREPSELCSGPGKLTEALGVGLELNGASLLEPPFGLRPPADPAGIEVVTGSRIGITKAVELPWRYCAAGNRHVSRPRI